MKVTVCQLPDPPDGFEAAWSDLGRHVEQHASDVVVLPELPFHAWVAWTDQFDQEEWDSAVASHDEWVARLGELGAKRVVGSRAVNNASGVGHNQAFVWDQGSVTYGHVKYYLPEEPGFWEATWYRRGEGKFRATEIGADSAGFMLCTDMWFTEKARGYARQGVRLLVTPRVTEAATTDKWIAGGRVAAIMAGAFGLSSNRSGSSHGVDFGGTGWVIDPDGRVLGLTSDDQPFITVEIEPEKADSAKKTYPRYVLE